MDLFVIASIFIVPSLVTSAAAIAMKLKLLRRNLKRRSEKRKKRNERMNQAHERRRTSTQYNEALLRMMADRYVVQKEREALDEQWNANERHRYDCLAHMLSVIAEECVSSHSRAYATQALSVLCLKLCYKKLSHRCVHVQHPFHSHQLCLLPARRVPHARRAERRLRSFSSLLREARRL